MIIGNGMIAKAFQNKSILDEVVIHAAGVSNSAESNEMQFNRDILSLKKSLKFSPNNLFIYISTSSVDYVESCYTIHKLKCEKIVANEREKFLIVRLPQVAGVVNNNTLIAYFTRMCLQGKEVFIQRSAFRNIVDVDDVVNVVLDAIQDFSSSKIAQLVAPYNISVEYIFLTICNELKIPCPYKLIDGGSEHVSVCSPIFTSLKAYENLYSVDYGSQVIRKYVRLLLNNFGHIWLSKNDF